MFPKVAPVTLNLIIANVLVYGLQLLQRDWMEFYFALWPIDPHAPLLVAPFHWWQLVTYGFMHDTNTIGHIFFNMFGLYMFGSVVERSMGAPKYLAYYFVCVLGAAVAQQLSMVFEWGPEAAVVGASGGLFGILLAFAIAYPHERLIVIPIPIPIPAWLYVSFFAAAELYMGVFGTRQGIAHFAHLGGAAAGYLLILYWRHGPRLRR